MTTTLPKDRLEHIARTTGINPAGLSDYQLFDRIAERAGIKVALTAGQKRTVLHRLGGKKKWQGYGIERLIIGVLTRDQKLLLGRRSAQTAKRAKLSAAANDRAMLESSMLQPVSRIAAEHEHLVVLVGLPATHFYATVEWKASRAAALRMAGYRCEWCGAAAKVAQLEVDHIVPRLIAPERAFDMNNLRVLCKPCHDGRHAADRGGW